MVKNGWPIERQRIVVGGSGPLLLAVADGLAKFGGRIISIAEQAPREGVLGFGLGLCLRPDKLWQGIGIKFRLAGVKYRLGTWPVRAEGDERVRRVMLTNGTETWTEECDLLACGFGLVPNVELALALGCELEEGKVKVDEWQATTTDGAFCAGEPTGIGGVDCALVEGRIAGYAASGRLEQARLLFKKRASWHRFRAALTKAFALRSELKRLATDETIVCRCEDVSLGRLRKFTQWRDAKLQSRCGMGACQGRVCGEATRFIFGWGMESVRPPILPARVDSLVSRAEPAPRS
jgi:NADPH-dependent 2,4-dienoyl-CoA reductase/sulfur reductase-like enzyme